MSDYTVRFIYNQGESNEYVFPLVFSISDPQEGMKSTIIEGNRGDGSLVIPGGKKSQDIKLRGKIAEDGFVNISTEMASMRTKVTTDIATLKMQFYSGGWNTVWSYNVRRISEISFPQSLRTDVQEYQLEFRVISY